MDFVGDLRLVFLLSLNAIVLFAALYAARRWTRDSVQRAVDAMLLWYLVQYASVCLPGVLHVLSAATMACVALAASATFFFCARRYDPLEDCLQPRESSIYLVAAVFIAAFLLRIIQLQSLSPLLDNDAITYHVPAVVQWLQTGKLGLFPTWFYNPANTFSPIGASAFIAWALAPLHGDTLARFTQAPAIFMVFLGVLQLARALGATPLIAATLAVAAAGCRLCTSVVANPRDDMFLAAFILVAVAGASPDRLREPFGPLRVAIAVGLSLAMKYTVLISLPLLLLLVHAPTVADRRWRQWLIAAGAVLVIAGPWYLRNLILFGNPLYPLRLQIMGRTVLNGLFVTERSEHLRTFGGAYGVFVDSYYGLPKCFAALLTIGWLASVAGSVHRWREPLVRACVFGPIVCAAVFLIKAPYGEARFLFPEIFVAFASMTLIANDTRWRRKLLYTVAGAILVGSLYTSYNARDLLIEALMSSIIAALLAVFLIWMDARMGRSRRVRAYVTTAAGLVFAGVVYVMWSPYVGTVNYHTADFWGRDIYYPRLAEGWKFVRDHVPEDATIAYSQTHLVYPLYGANLARRVVYAPVRSDVLDVLHLPRFPVPLPGERINNAFTSLLNASPDRDTWLTRLKQTRAQYLFIYLGGVEPHPPEERFAHTMAAFTEAYRDTTVVIYKIDW